MKILKVDMEKIPNFIINVVNLGDSNGKYNNREYNCAHCFNINGILWYAKTTMKFIDNYAAKNNYNVIRLTVYENNINAIKLYEKNGFKRIEEGNWSLEDKIFIGFEKIME